MKSSLAKSADICMNWNRIKMCDFVQRFGDSSVDCETTVL